VTRKPGFYDWLVAAGATHESSILDVGAGSGHLLYCLAQEGFVKLTGLDKYNNGDLSIEITSGRGKRTIAILCSDITDVSGKYDVIILSHVLEHLPDQQAALTSLKSCLSPHGAIIIRIPLTDSWAWEHYRENWIQLDPPRHFFLHTRASLDILSQQCGLHVSKVIFDSTGMQFWGSEQARRGIPLQSPDSVMNLGARSSFGKSGLRRFDYEAGRLNRAQRGDQATFVLRQTVGDRSDPKTRGSLRDVGADIAGFISE